MAFGTIPTHSTLKLHHKGESSLIVRIIFDDLSFCDVYEALLTDASKYPSPFPFLGFPQMRFPISSPTPNLVQVVEGGSNHASLVASGTHSYSFNP